jgi:hypothetical protein
MSEGPRAAELWLFVHELVSAGRLDAAPHRM